VYTLVSPPSPFTQVLGVVQLVNKHSRDGFTEADESGVARLCSQLHTAVVNCRSLSKTRNKLADAQESAKRQRTALMFHKAVTKSRESFAVARVPEGAPATMPTAEGDLMIMCDGRLVEYDERRRSSGNEDHDLTKMAAAADAAAAAIGGHANGRHSDTEGAATLSPRDSSKESLRSGVSDSVKRRATISGSSLGNGDVQSGTKGLRAGKRASAAADDTQTSAGAMPSPVRSVLRREASFGSRDASSENSFTRRSSEVGGQRLTREEDMGNKYPLSLASATKAYAILGAQEGRTKNLTTDDMASFTKFEASLRALAPVAFGISREMHLGALGNKSADGGVIQRKRMHALLELGQAVLSHEGSEEGLLRAASMCALSMASAHGCRIFVHEDGVLWTSDTQRRRQQWVPEEAGIAGQVLLDGHSITLEKEAHLHPKFLRAVDWDASGDPSSFLCAPLKGSGSQVLGVLCAGRRTDGGFTIEEQAMLEMAGRTALSLLTQTQMVSRERRARVGAEALLNTLGSLPSGMNLEDILAQIAGHARALLNCRRCRVFVCNPDEEALYFIHRHRDSTSQILGASTTHVDDGSFSSKGLVEIEWGVGIVGHIARSGEFVSSARPHEHPCYVPAVDRGDDGGTALASAQSSETISGGLLGTAVQGTDGRIAGVVLVMDKLGGPFNAADEALLKHVSELVSKELSRNATLNSLSRAQKQSDNLLLASEMLHFPVQEQDANALMARLQREAVWRCLQLTGAEACALYEFNAEDNTITLVEHNCGEDTEGGTDGPRALDALVSVSNAGIPFDVRRGLVGGVATSGQQRLVVDPAGATAFDEEIDNPFDLSELRSMELVPCFGSHNEQDGETGASSVIVLFNKRRTADNLGGKLGIFSESDHRTLSVYSRLLGSVHSYIVGVRDAQGKLRGSSSIIDVATTLTSNLQGQNLYHNITSLARHLVPSEWSTLYLADENFGTLMQVKDDGTPGAIVRMGDGIAGCAAQSMASITMRSPGTDPRFLEGHYGSAAVRVKEILAFPLIDSHGVLKGVLELCNRVNAPNFHRGDELMLTPFCTLAGITLHNSRMLQMAQKTGTDSARLARRSSMLGVRRNAPAAAPGALSGDGEEDKEDEGAVEIELLSRRKMRASVFQSTQNAD
jgi:GAF domain-containing protein